MTDRALDILLAEFVPPPAPAGLAARVAAAALALPQEPRAYARRAPRDRRRSWLRRPMLVGGVALGLAVSGAVAATLAGVRLDRLPIVEAVLARFSPPPAAAPRPAPAAPPRLAPPVVEPAPAPTPQPLPEAPRASPPPALPVVRSEPPPAAPLRSEPLPLPPPPPRVEAPPRPGIAVRRSIESPPLPLPAPVVREEAVAAPPAVPRPAATTAVEAARLRQDRIERVQQIDRLRAARQAQVERLQAARQAQIERLQRVQQSRERLRRIHRD
ncbi:hypothetical protein [Sphingosinicella sp.]|uniref:hypothetical protein n=1 Tax=Sphingosinicella sp. TaxID=1917971 RepID=UPI0040382EC8